MISYLRFMLLRASYILWFSSLAIGVYVAHKLLRDTPTSSLAYVGSASCQNCHSSERSGNAVEVWIRSRHAVAYQSIRKELATRSATNLEVGDSVSCYRCHTTLGHPPATVAEAGVVAEGVGCERCHGPGSEYSSYGIMADESRFLGHGGVKGSLSDCRHCHTLPAERPQCPSSGTATTDVNALWSQIRHHGRDTIATTTSTITNRN
ncbi:MAG: hypothetical protein JNJ94_05780 [Chlorobi bacterium]|jgi:nitrate/TMAO reductase-like tetraheme cytochrome c subunit|nr:hypothetical protein [Chlorobiota bacterium]